MLHQRWLAAPAVDDGRPVPGRALPKIKLMNASGVTSPDSTGGTAPAVPAAHPLRAALVFGTPIIVLALGHMLSSMVRTLPAVAADVISADIRVSPETLASLTGAYHFAFAAGQIPVGVALDRFGVRAVALTLLAIVAMGAALAAIVGGAQGFLIAQIVLGIGCSGMLLCPMTLAAKLLTPAQFGLWSGIILGVGNSGMLLSASPMAWLIEQQGWRMAFWVTAASAVIVAGLVALLVASPPADASRSRNTLLSEARQVVAIGFSRRLRGVILLSLTSLGASLAIRGLWGGPWLMEVKHLGRIDAGTALLPLTVALALAPIMYGTIDRRIGRRRMFIVASHAVAGFTLLFIAAGGPGGVLSQLVGLNALPAAVDVWALFVFGMAIAVQPLLFATARSAVSADQAGKALSAVNLTFFVGTALLQASSTPVASIWGYSAVMLFIGLAVLITTAGFVLLSPRAQD